MTSSLDSNVIIDILNGRHDVVRSRFRAARNAGEPMVVSSIAAHEVLFGANISARPGRQTRNALELLTMLGIADWTMDDAAAAADLRGRLRRLGLPIGGFDMLIAGQALNRSWTVVTANTREFARVEGLAIEDWSRPAA